MFSLERSLDLSGLSESQQGWVIRIAKKNGSKAAMVTRVFRRLNARESVIRND